MNQNVGASFGLSVLTVVFFSVILYQPEHKVVVPPLAGAPARPVEPVEAIPPTEPPGPASAGTVDLAPAGVGPVAVAAEPKVSVPVPVEKPEARSRPDVPPRAAAVARPVSRRSPRDVATVETRGAFTQVREGETLSDVARRVYGTVQKARSLWLANRDVVDRADAPLPAGSLLRTP